MQRLKNTFSRLKTISFKRMFHYANLVKAESGKWKLRILFDMVFCYLRYGVGYLDYLTFGFIYQDRAHRLTFMTMNRNLELVRKLNDPAFRHFFDDKLEFNKTFREYLGRDFIDLREVDDIAFSNFLKGKKTLFAKKLDEFGGKGIERIEIGNDASSEAGRVERSETWNDASSEASRADARALWNRLLSGGMYDVEEAIVQHPEMNRLAGSSINSLRMVTLEKDGEISLMYTLVRMSDGESFVDNISSGGMYCPVAIWPASEINDALAQKIADNPANEAGVITADAFQDKTGLYYDRHPKSGTVFKGFRIPFFDEAVALVKRAAKIIPEIRYVGWDVAITPSGPVLIEGNVIPGYDMCQNYRHLGKDKTGILPKFKAILKDEI